MNGPIILHDIETLDEMHTVEELQREVWRFGDLDIVPAAQLRAVQASGGILIGAFAGEEMVGFVYGHGGFEHGHVTIHSHMAAVRPAYRNFDVGYRLKLAQRDAALARGVNRVSWTYDPLQSLNAHFNIVKLGVVSDRYIVDFYGDETSSFLHSIGTDRLWCTWLLGDRRVVARLENPPQREDFTSEWAVAPVVVSVGRAGQPGRGDLAAALEGDSLAIEIPADINALREADPELAREWRKATRWAFTAAVPAGFVVVDFVRAGRERGKAASYLLSRTWRESSEL